VLELEQELGRVRVLAPGLGRVLAPGLGQHKRPPSCPAELLL